MDHVFKFFWVLRGLFYKPFFARYLLPGYIGSPVFLLGIRGMYIGRRVRIFPGLRAECHDNGRLYIHDNVSIGQGFHVIASGELHIGSGCLISGNVFITDTDHTFEHIGVPVFEQANRISQTCIGENCFLGIGVCIQAGTTLGKGCIVGANSVVRGDFPDNCVIVGAPARIVRRYDPQTSQWERLTSQEE